MLIMPWAINRKLICWFFFFINRAIFDEPYGCTIDKEKQSKQMSLFPVNINPRLALEIKLPSCFSFTVDHAFSLSY